MIPNIIYYVFLDSSTGNLNQMHEIREYHNLDQKKNNKARGGEERKNSKILIYQKKSISEERRERYFYTIK